MSEYDYEEDYEDEPGLPFLQSLQSFDVFAIVGAGTWVFIILIVLYFLFGIWSAVKGGGRRNPRVGRAVHSRVHALPGQPHRPERAVDRNRVACARARSCETPNTCANGSSSREDCGDMRRVLRRGRIEALLTWLFEWSWRSVAGNPLLKLV